MKQGNKWIAFSLLLTIFAASLWIWFNIDAPFDRERIVNEPSIEYIHFSVDDCLWLFQDLTDNQDEYSSIFDQDTLGFLKEMHDQYGVVFSLYVFYDWDLERQGFDLSMATGKFQSEFEANSEWLKFGFHASDTKFYERNTPQEAESYYHLTMLELERIVGRNALDLFVRLDRYTASDEVVYALCSAENPLRGLLIADRADAQTRNSYGLSDMERRICYDQDWYCDDLGVFYTPTDLRLEEIDSDDEFYSLVNEMYDQKVLIVFTHENELSKESVRRYCELLAEYAVEYELKSDYPQNNIG